MKPATPRGRTFRCGSLTLSAGFTSLICVSAPAFAHVNDLTETPSGSAGGLLRWELDPFIVVPLLLTGVLYLLGIRKMWASSRTGLGISRREAAAFWLGWLALVAALLSPIHTLSEELFSIHMIQHELLMLVAAPLLALGRPLLAFTWALPPGGRSAAGASVRSPWIRAAWAFISNPLAAWSIHAAALWIWHVPRLFEATLRSDGIHTLQHACFLGSALVFWWALFHRRPGWMGYGAAILYLFTTAMHSGLLGALLTLADIPLYPAYAPSAARWGLTPLEDQQLGGLIMWVPAGLAYAVAALALMTGWLHQADRRAASSEPRPWGEPAGDSLT